MRAVTAMKTRMFYVDMKESVKVRNIRNEVGEHLVAPPFFIRFISVLYRSAKYPRLELNQLLKIHVEELTTPLRSTCENFVF